MCLRDRLCDEQAETRPRDLAVDHASRAEEALEHAVGLSRRQSDAAVAHLEHGAVRRPARPHVNVAALGRELERVRDEVVEQLEDPTPVATHR